jgi:hypothetical protein
MPEPPKLDPVFEATVRRMLATPSRPNQAVKKKAKNAKK